MKKIVILLFMFLPFVNLGQDYQFICSPGTTYYKNIPGYLKAFRQDSILVTGANDTTFYSYRTILGNNTPCLDTIGGSVLGRRVFKRHDGWFYFFNRATDTIFLNTQGAVGATWKFCKLSDTSYLQAEIIAVDTETVLGLQDQVKIVSLQAKNTMNVNIPNVFNQKQVKLSKNYGLSQTINMYLLPSDTNIYTLCGKTALSLGIQNLQWQEIFDYDTGDIFHYSGNFTSNVAGGYWDKMYKVLSKITYGNNDSVLYTMEYCKHEVVGSIGNPPEIYDTYDTLTLKYNWTLLDLNNQWAFRLPEQFVDAGYYTDLYYQNSQMYNDRRMKGRVQNKYAWDTTNCWYFWGGWYYTAIYTYEYSEGLGNTKYSYYFIPELSSIYYGESLVYYKKGTEIWGTPVTTSCSILVPARENDNKISSQTSVHIIPNPLVSSSTISIVTPDINTHPVLEIIDTYGRSVFRSDIHNGQITFHRNGLAPGLYLVLIMNEGKVIGTEKMIVR